MGPLGHLSVGMAVKQFAPRVPLAVLLVATWFLDLLAVALGYLGIEGGLERGNPWSHSLFMACCWSVLAGLLTYWAYHGSRAALVVGLALFSHWVLDLISHPIPFPSFSFRTWTWDYGHPLPPDLPLFLAGSPRVALGLYNHISAVQATLLEAAMFLAGTAVYVHFRRSIRATRIA
jgi:hypothetical protein